ncbi:type II secretion system secretin GspD [Marinibaculum pumilum]|uniref:Type II secretion system secretin GspD n=1 Tax=Marinibaculum pumilum TaxID=1766165 RepID=A0ABV7L1R8_9PROT
MRPQRPFPVRGWPLRGWPALASGALALALLSLAGCSDFEERFPKMGPIGSAPGPKTLVRDASPTARTTDTASEGLSIDGGPRPPAQVVMGTGAFANLPALKSSAGIEIPPGDPVTLDFDGVDVRDVLRSVLGNLLGLSYSVDSAVQGTVTLKTGSPIPRDQVLSVLTDALQLANVVLVERDGVFLALPADKAAQQAALGGGAGLVTRIVPVRYVSVADLQKALQPLTPAGTTVQADQARGLLTITGPAQDVAQVEENVEVFDADFMRGMSFAVIPLRYGRAKEIADEANAMLATASPSAKDVVRVFAVGRLNAVLVTSRQPGYIARMRDWLDRLDRGDESSQPRIYVYRVRNGRATDLGRVLSEALGIQQAGGGGGPGGGPGDGNGLGSDGLDGSGSGSGFGSGQGGGLSGDGLDPATPATSPVASNDPAPPPRAGAGPLGSVGDVAQLAAGATDRAGVPPVRVSVDRANNALVIVAPPRLYRDIEAALEKLDVPPLQVLIEATVAEVTLGDNLSLGLQYAFQSGNFAGVFAPNVAATTAATTTTAGAGAGTLANFPGFSFVPGANLLYTTASASVMLQALSQLTTVRVLAAPNLMVLNNGTARLQVGDQVPTQTQTSTSTITPNAPTVSSIQYRDTGIILHIRPRVNDSGLVVLDIFEEISQPVATQSSEIKSPTIQQRQVTSSVAVHDGETIALAGLIDDRETRGNSGVPWLQEIPVLGYLFGTRNDTRRRTELLVMITPRVVRGRFDGEAVTDELRERMLQVAPLARRS